MKKLLLLILCTGILCAVRGPSVPKNKFYKLHDDVAAYTNRIHELSTTPKKLQKALIRSRPHAYSLLRRMALMMDQYPHDPAVQSFKFVFDPMKKALNKIEQKN